MSTPSATLAASTDTIHPATEHEIRRVFAEVSLAGRFDTVNISAVRHFVQIIFQDLVFGRGVVYFDS